MKINEDTGAHVQAFIETLMTVPPEQLEFIMLLGGVRQTDEKIAVGTLVGGEAEKLANAICFLIDRVTETDSDFPGLLLARLLPRLRDFVETVVLDDVKTISDDEVKEKIEELVNRVRESHSPKGSTH